MVKELVEDDTPVLLRKSGIAVKQQESEIEGLTATLRAVYHEVTRRGPLSQHAANLSHVLQVEAEREMLVGQKLDHLSSMAQRTLNSEELGIQKSTEPSKTRFILRDTFLGKYIGMHLTYDITDWFDRAKQLTTEFNAAVQQAISAIAQDDADAAADFLKKAILANRYLEDLLNRILTIEKRMLRSLEQKRSQS